MIIKDRDSREKDLRELKRLLSLSNLSLKQRFLIEREIYAIKRGELGEEDSAYYINFYYADSKNWAVIHDLRIEFNGKVAQIDHVLINRLFDIYVLESKNYRYGLRITEAGEFEVKYKNYYIGIPSPIEQNKRHIELLSKFIKAHDFLPKRLGIRISPRFLNYVLVSPRAVIRRPRTKRLNFSNVIKADMLNTIIEKNADELDAFSAFGGVVKLASSATLEEFAKKLASYHKPLSVNWKRRFGIKDNKRYFCFKCGASISEKEAKFCWNNKKRFKGKAFCYRCQKEIK